MRRARTQAVADASLEMGKLAFLTADFGESGNENEKYKEAERRLLSTGLWVADGSVEEDLEKGVEALRELVQA